MFESSKKKQDMATKKEDVKETVNDTVNEEKGIEKATEKGLAKIEADGFDEMFNFAKTAKGIEITAEYLDLNTLPIGENVIFILEGMTTFTDDKGEKRPAVSLLNEQRTKFIAASKVIVSACEKIQDLPAAIGITVHGKKKSGAGSYFDCTVVRY